ncbi:MAG: transcription termination factor Rho [Desulfamplus sp.]|nr:transcription termination factor Rho [Desulfamplus sp.]
MEPVQGHLEIMDKGYGFLRNIYNNYSPDASDAYLSNNIIIKNRLREGNFISGSGVKKNTRNKNLSLTSIDTINGLTPDEFNQAGTLQDQTSINPFERFTLTQNHNDILGRALDMIIPMGMGQRGLIIAPPKSGKTTILKHIANSLLINHPDTEVFVLLVNERPEEVTDFQRGLKGAHVLYSSSDQQTANHLRIARLAVQSAACCAEAGKNAVILIDSLTKMTRAFNSESQSYGRTMTGGLGINAMEMPRKIFGAARKVEKGASLTIIATILVDTGSRMDDIIYQEFKGTGNLDLVLSRKCAEKRIWPAIDINMSGTRQEILLMDQDEYQKNAAFRRDAGGLDEVAAMSHLMDYLQVGN